MKSKFDEFIHEFKNAEGETRFGVAKYDSHGKIFLIPICLKFGCNKMDTYRFGKKLEEMTEGYATKVQAYNHAYYLFKNEV